MLVGKRLITLHTEKHGFWADAAGAGLDAVLVSVVTMGSQYSFTDKNAPPYKFGGAGEKLEHKEGCVHGIYEAGSATLRGIPSVPGTLFLQGRILCSGRLLLGLRFTLRAVARASIRNSILYTVVMMRSH